MPARLRVFPAISRNRDPKKYVGELLRVAEFADRNGFEGILLFEGNDVFVEPWAMAQHIMAETTRSSPLIAVNPVYMHPFTAAKFVSSLAQLYGRKVYLNMITGTAVSDLQGLGDEQSHGERYVRLGEFVALMRQLLSSPRPVNFEGRFYRASNLQLRPRLPAELMPEFLIAGQSEAAQRVAKETGCIKMQMLPPDLDRGLSAPGMNFGIFARESREEARQAAKARFRDNPDDRELLTLTVANSDSTWKRSLYDGQSGELADNGYWLLPFLTFQADCPYLVGSFTEIGAKLKEFAAKGLTTAARLQGAGGKRDVLGCHAKRTEPRQRLAAFRPSQKLHDMPLQTHEFGFGHEVMASRPCKGQHDILNRPAGPCAHHHDAIGEEQCLVDVVGDKDRSGRDLAPDVEQNLLHHGARLRIERAEGLVHQQHPRLVDQNPRDLDALLHPAGQLRRIKRLEAGKTDQLQDGIGGAVALGAGDAAHLWAEGHVVPHPFPRKQGVLLKHHAAVRARPHDRLSVDRELARRDRQMSGQRTEQRGLAAAGRAENADEFARRDRDIEPAHRLECIDPRSERDRDIGKVDTADALRADIRNPNVHRATFGLRQGIASRPAVVNSQLEPMPSRPIISMPTMMSA
jgi:alkanesulfonate monooxygenase